MIMKHQYLKPIVLLLMAVLLAPVQALAIEFSVDGISYSTTSAWEVEVVRTAGDYKGDVVIPGAVTYEGTTYRVTAIGESAIMGPNVTSLTLPEGTIRTIKYRGCYDLRNVTSITVPASVTEIGEEAFRFCSSLTDLFFHSPKPPTVASNTFANISKTECKIHVPTGSLTDYQALPEITAFSNVDEWGYFEIYDLKVVGCLVTEANLDVFGDGSVVYAPNDNKTLTINKDLVTTEPYQPVVFNEGVEGLNIQFNNCTLTSASGFCLNLVKETALRGTATIESIESFAVYTSSSLFIYDATINFNGCIFCDNYLETLSISNSNITGVVTSGSAIQGFDTVSLGSTCFFQSPTGANHDGSQLVDGKGNAASSFVIKAGTPTSYGLWLAGTQVTDENCYDVLGNDEASYDPTSNTLTINGPITAIVKGESVDDHGQYAIDCTIQGLTINVANDVTLTSAQSTAIRVIERTTITGSHTLTIMSPSGSGIYARQGRLTIQDVDIILGDCNDGIVRPTGNNWLNVINSTIEGSAKSGNAVIRGFSNCTLEDCLYEEPYGPHYSDRQLLDIDDNPAAKVKIVRGETKYSLLLWFPRDVYIATVGKAFTAPELNNSWNVDVTYSSNNTDVATVDPATGEVTIKGKGVAIISATFAGDAMYYPYKASYYLVVSKQEGLQYDVNLDGKVTITDAVSVVNAILNGTE